MGSNGLVLDQADQIWFLNNATLYGTAPVDSNSDFDVLTRKDYVDGAILSSLTQ
jgi:hypothetical protein